MRGRALVGFALTCGMALAACSFFVDTGDLEGGGIASVGDASDVTSIDSGADSSSPLDSGAADAFIFSCDATLCDDFDESTSFKSVWNVSPGVGATLMITPKGQSLPNAFEPTVLVQSGESHANISAVFSPSVATPHFRLEFDMRLSAKDPTANEADVLDIEAHGAIPSGYSVYLGDFQNHWRIAEFASLPDGGTIDHSSSLVVTPHLDAWSHVVFTSDGTMATVTLDGVVAGQITLDQAAAETGISRTLDVGWTYVDNNTDPLDGLFDDVSMTFLP